MGIGATLPAQHHIPEDESRLSLLHPNMLSMFEELAPLCIQDIVGDTLKHRNPNFEEVYFNMLVCTKDRNLRPSTSAWLLKLQQLLQAGPEVAHSGLCASELFSEHHHYRVCVLFREFIADPLLLFQH